MPEMPAINTAWRHSATRRFLAGSHIRAWWEAPEKSGKRGDLLAGPWCLRAFAWGKAGRWEAPVFLGVLAAALAARGHAMLAALLGVACVASILPVAGVACLPLASVWSPRLPVLDMGNEALFFRLDHALVLGVTLRLALSGGVDRPRLARDAWPGVLCLLAPATSAVAGVLEGTVQPPEAALLQGAQCAHLLAVMYLAYVYAPRLGAAGVHAWTLPILGAAAYGLAEARWPFREAPGVAYRTFERVVFEGQANHFAALFAVAAAVGLALLRQPRWRALGACLVVLPLAAWPGTGSRTGAAAFVAVAGLHAMAAWRGARWGLPALGGLAMLAVPVTWWYRVSAPGSSMFDRLLAWQSALATVPAHPLLGLGPGARHRSFYDNHYVMTLSEQGMLGLAALAVGLLYLARALRRGAARGGEAGALCLGGGVALGAAGVCGLASIAFVISVIAGTLFWWCGYALGRARREDAA